MVQALPPHYKKSKIAEALRMNSVQLELGCQKSRSSDEITQGGFAIGYLGHQPSSIARKTQQQCELTLKGSCRSVQISIDVSQLVLVLPLIEQHL